MQTLFLRSCDAPLTPPLVTLFCVQYYTGEAVAPYPTLFIGGNHEACNYLWEARTQTTTSPRTHFLCRP
jgi:lariat debranching enzyme